MTTKQKIHDYIISYHKKHGSVPSQKQAERDLGGTGGTRQNIGRYYKEFVKEGVLEENKCDLYSLCV